MINEDEISCKEFLKLKRTSSKINLIDVREQIEFATFNIGGIHIPLNKLPQLIESEEIPFNKEDEIYVICQHGIRSKSAQIMLKNDGFKQVKNVKGGLINVAREMH